MAYNTRTIHELTVGVPDADNDELIFWDTSGGVVRKVTMTNAFEAIYPSVRKELVEFAYTDLSVGAGTVLWWPEEDFILTDLDLIVTTPWIASTATCISLGNGLLYTGVADPQQYLSEAQCAVAKIAVQNAVISGFHNAASVALISGGKRHYMIGGIEPLSNENSTRYVKVVTDGDWTSGEAIACIRGYYLT